MPSVTKYPQTIVHDTHTSDQTNWTNLNGIKNSQGTEGNYGTTNVISGKTGSNPKICPITCKNFQFNLPNGAKVKSIVVEYAHRKFYKTAYDYPNIGAPTFTLTGTNLASNIISKTGATPPNTSFSDKKTLKWNGVLTSTGNAIVVGDVNQNNLIYNQNYNLPSAETINSHGFGVKVSYPANTNDNQGYIHLQYLRITINYEVPSYEISVTNMNTDTVYANVEQPIIVNVNNLKLMNYSPTLVITLPTGAEVKSINPISNQDFGDVSIAGNIVTWNAKLNDLRGYIDIQINATFTAGENKTITAVEQDYNYTGSLTFTVQPAQTGIIDTDGVDKNCILYAKTNVDFTIPIQVPLSILEFDSSTNLYLIFDKAIRIKNTDGSTYTSIAAGGYYTIPISRFDETGYLELTAKKANTGITNVSLSTTTNPESTNFIIKCISSDLTNPIFTILRLNTEELARLGNHITYSINSSLKINCNASNIPSFVDYYRNFRFGVVNHIDTNDRVEIFEACKNWSDGITAFNVYEEKIVEFNYNNEYPVYIVFVGDYPVTNYFNLQFTYPCLIESSKYEGYDTTSIFPAPFNNLITNDANSELSLAGHGKTNMIILSEFPLDLDFGTDNSRAVRGIKLDLNIETQNVEILTARLKSSNGLIGEQSIVLTPNQHEYTIGGEFDLWGFNIGEMTNVETWECELEISNNDSVNNTAFINDLLLSVYFLKLDDGLKEKVFVDGENLEWYGAFISNVKVPFGVKTDTKFLNITGTDTNDSYLMTIEEKDLELEFSVDGCDLKESTELLKQIVKLFTNKRDELNKPIPKELVLSYNPDEYYEFLLESAINSQINIAGYDCDAKLTIPAGTSFKREDTITNTTGLTSSLGKVSPKIVVIPTSTEFELVEQNTEQKFTATYSDSWIGKYVEIDCINQKMYLRDDEAGDPTNITIYADYDVDWFSIEGVYKFIPVGCILHTIRYTERGV